MIQHITAEATKDLMRTAPRNIVLTAGKYQFSFPVVKRCLVNNIDNIASKTADSLIEPETHDILNFT